MDKKRTALLNGAMVAVLAVSLAACGSSSAKSTPAASGSTLSKTPSLGHIDLVLGGPPSTSLSLMVFGVAQQLGVWKQLGLDVTVSGLAGQSTAAQELIANKVQVATVGPETYIQAVSSNKPVPIKAFYTWVRKPTWDIVVPANSPIQTLADLKGKTIGVAQIGKSDGRVAQAVIAEASGESPSSVRLLPVGNGASAQRALQKGQVAAYSDGDASAAQIQGLGLQLRTIPLPAEYAQASDVTFSATNSYITSHSAQLIALGKGWGEAVTFCKANLDACVKAFWKQYPISKPQNAGSNYAAAAVPFKAVLNARLPKYYADDGQWGETQLSGWLADASVYGYQNVDHTKLSSYFTNQFVTQMSQFDANFWVQKANTYHG